MLRVFLRSCGLWESWAPGKRRVDGKDEPDRVHVQQRADVDLQSRLRAQLRFREPGLSRRWNLEWHPARVHAAW